MDLASVLLGDQATQSQNLQLRQGVVTQVSPLLVKVGAATTAQPCNALSGYGAALGDVVSVLVIDGDRLVLGRASGTSSATGVTTFAPVRRGGGTIDTIGTVGAVASGRYQISDGKCFVSILYTFGSSGASANVGVTTFDAPVPFGAGTDSFQNVGSGTGVQAGTRFNFQVTRDGSANGFQLYAPSQVTSASPGAVTFSDGWRFNGWYWV